MLALTHPPQSALSCLSDWMTNADEGAPAVCIVAVLSSVLLALAPTVPVVMLARLLAGAGQQACGMMPRERPCGIGALRHRGLAVSGPCGIGALRQRTSP